MILIFTVKEIHQIRIAANNFEAAKQMFIEHDKELEKKLSSNEKIISRKISSISRSR